MAIITTSYTKLWTFINIRCLLNICISIKVTINSIVECNLSQWTYFKIKQECKHCKNRSLTKTFIISSQIHLIFIHYPIESKILGLLASMFLNEAPCWRTSTSSLLSSPKHLFDENKYLWTFDDDSIKNLIHNKAGLFPKSWFIGDRLILATTLLYDNTGWT